MRALTALALFGGVSCVAGKHFPWSSRQSSREQTRSTLVHNLAARSAADQQAPQTNITRGTKNPADDPRFKPFGCGVNGGEAATQDLIDVSKALFSEHNGGAPGARLRARALRTREEQVMVDVAIHIVTTKGKEGSIGQDIPQKQVDALNKAYKDTGFSFKLLSSDFTANDAWATGANEDDVAAMKSSLRKGKYSTLNLYFQTDPAGATLGVCTMPSDISDPSKPKQDVDPKLYADDGCVVHAGTLPEGSLFGYSMGMTAAHETGHWLGLFHVFEGYACDGDGDLIADTAPQSQSTDGCPTSPVTASCPGNVWKLSELGGAQLPPGVKEGDEKVDNIHNVMDYSTDACYTGFTPLQIQRMKDLWGMYRKDR